MARRVRTAFMRLIARNRRRYGGYIVHIGVVVCSPRSPGSRSRRSTTSRFKAGEAHELTDPWGQRWRFVSQGVSTFSVLNRHVTAVVLEMSVAMGNRTASSRARSGSTSTAAAQPTFEPSTEVGIRARSGKMLYVVLAGVRGDESAEIRITFNPLVGGCGSAESSWRSAD